MKLTRIILLCRSSAQLLLLIPFLLSCFSGRLVAQLPTNDILEINPWYEDGNALWQTEPGYVYRPARSKNMAS